MDLEALAWSLRLQETETLLHSRQEDFNNQVNKRQELERRLERHERQKRQVQLRLARTRSHLAVAREGVLSCSEELTTLREDLACGAILTALRARQGQAEKLQGRLTHTMLLEASRNQAFLKLMAGHTERCLGTRHTLEAALSRLTAMDASVAAQCDVTGLEEELAALRQHQAELSAQRDEAQNEATGRIAAADELSRQVDDALQQQAQELEQVKEQRSAALDSLAQVRQQQVSNDDEIRSTRQQQAVVRQQQQELEAAIQRAHQTIYHLAGSYVP